MDEAGEDACNGDVTPPSGSSRASSTSPRPEDLDAGVATWPLKPVRDVRDLRERKIRSPRRDVSGASHDSGPGSTKRKRTRNLLKLSAASLDQLPVRSDGAQSSLPKPWSVDLTMADSSAVDEAGENDCNGDVTLLDGDPPSGSSRASSTSPRPEDIDPGVASWPLEPVRGVRGVGVKKAGSPRRAVSGMSHDSGSGSTKRKRTRKLLKRPSTRSAESVDQHSSDGVRSSLPSP